MIASRIFENNPTAFGLLFELFFYRDLMCRSKWGYRTSARRNMATQKLAWAHEKHCRYKK